MITLPQLTYQASGGTAPYEYTWTTSDSCLSLSTTEGISTNGIFTNIITATTEACLTGTSVTLTTVDANGCPSSETFYPSNICNSFTLGSVTQTGDYVFTVSATSIGCSGINYQWNYDSTLFTGINVISNGSGSTVQIQPLDGVVFPATTNISVTATDCRGCIKTSTLVFAICRPQAANFTYNLYCNDAETRYVGATYYIPEPTGCDYDYDWDTIEFGPINSGITIEPTSASRLFQLSADISLTPGLYSVDYSVSSTDGIQTLQGTITIIINSCSPGNTISLPLTTYQIDCGILVGDVVEIPILFGTNDPSVVIDWNTWTLSTPPTPSSPSIQHAVQVDGTHVIQYEIPGDTPGGTPEGTDVFQWTVCDTEGNCATTTTYTIILDCAAAPILSVDTACVECGSSVIINVLDNDDPNDSVIDQTSIQITTAPTLGVANPLPNGTIIYTPTASTGNDSFYYNVANTSGSYSDTPAEVTVEIFCSGNDATTALCNT